MPNSDELKGYITKGLIFALTIIATKLHSSADAPTIALFATDLADAGVAAYAFYRQSNMRLVPEKAIVVGQAPTVQSAVAQSVTVK